MNVVLTWVCRWCRVANPLTSTHCKGCRHQKAFCMEDR